MKNIHYETLWYAARTGKNFNLCQVVDSVNWKNCSLCLINSKTGMTDYVEDTIYR